MAVLSTLSIVHSAQASTFVDRDTAPELAAQIAHSPSSVTSATFVSVPTSGEPNGVSNAYGTMVEPRDGAEMAILSNGDARAPSDIGYPGGHVSNDLTGGSTRGAHDVTILRLGIAVPAGANCLTIDFDFFTMDFAFSGVNEESSYDSFLAELDPSAAWSIAGAATTAPDNFVVDSGGNPVSKASAGGTPGGPRFGYNGMEVGANAVGTGYDTLLAGGAHGGALSWATALTPVSPGAHTLDLSIFDRVDGIYDSAAVLDNLRYIRRTAGNCPRGIGVGVDVDAPEVTLDAPANGSSTTQTAPALTGSRGMAAEDSETVHVKLYAGGAATGAPIQTLTAASVGDGWQATPSPLAPGTYTAQAEQLDSQENVGTSAAHTFTVLGPPGGPSGGPAKKVGATNGDDVLNGTPGPDLLCGLLGNDTINGLGANDRLFGDACGGKAGAKDGKDRLNGGAGRDLLSGGGGNDVLNGGRGNDTLAGGKGRNRYSGGSGNDVVRAANGVKDRVNCGAGKKDRATADRKDRLRGCERVRRRR